MLKKIIVFILFSIILNVDSQTNNVINLDLDSAIIMSYKNNLDYKKANIEIVRKKLALATIWSKFLFYPIQSSISTTLSKTYRNPDIELTSSTSSLTNDSSFNFSIDASYTFRFSDYFSAIDTINDYNQENILFKKSKNDLIKSVTSSYFKLVMLEEKILLIERELNNSKIRFDDINKRYKSGYSSELDKLKAEINYLDLIPELDKEKNNYKTELINFKNILGINESDDVKLTTLIPEINNFSIDEKFNSNNNYDILITQKEHNKNINSINISAIGFLPTFRVGYTFNTSFKKDAFQDRWFAGQEDWDNYTNRISLTFTIPLQTFLPFSKEQDYLINYINQVRKSYMDMTITKDNIDKEITTVINSIISGLKNMNSLIQNLKLSEKIFKLSETEYNNGNLSYNDLIEAEQNFEEYKFKLLNARINLIINILEYDYLLNNDYFNFKKIQDNR